MQIDKKKTSLIVAFLILFGAGLAGGYFYFAHRLLQRQETETTLQKEEQYEDFSTVRVYYPSGDRLVMEERKVPRQFSVVLVAEAAVREFLKGPSGRTSATDTGNSEIPAGARLLGVYPGSDKVLYVNLSDEFRRNFQGAARNEVMLLKGLYESIISNVQGIEDIKIVIEGKEIESIGGHILTLYPLKGTLQGAG